LVLGESLRGLGKAFHSQGTRHKEQGTLPPLVDFPEIRKKPTGEFGGFRWLTGKELQSADGGRMKGVEFCSRKNELR